MIEKSFEIVEAIAISETGDSFYIEFKEKTLIPWGLRLIADNKETLIIRCELKAGYIVDTEKPITTANDPICGKYKGDWETLHKEWNS